MARKPSATARAVQEGSLLKSAPACEKSVSLGRQAQVFWQIFPGVGLGFNSDDAVRPFPSSHTALPCKLRQFMVHICPLHRLLFWDDKSSHLSADNPPNRKAAGSSHYLFSAPTSPWPFLKSSGEHLHSQQHRTNSASATHSWQYTVQRLVLARDFTELLQ